MSVDSAIEILEGIPSDVDHADSVGHAIEVLKAAIAAGQVVSPPYDAPEITIRITEFAVCRGSSNPVQVRPLDDLPLEVHVREAVRSLRGAS